jgi:hypothetical protein
MKSKNLSKFKTVQTACTLGKGQFLFASSSDALLNTDYELTYVFRYDTTSDDKTPWVWNDYDWTVVSLCFWARNDLKCILSREGQVNIYGPGGNPDHTFQIPEAGVFGDAANDLGYVNRIRVIGDSLYVCGMSRQVYRFMWDGKDLSAGQWLNVAGSMRQPPSSEPPDDDGDAFDQWLEDNDSIDLVDVAGPSEKDIYAVGDEVWHFDGHAWQPLEMPSQEPLAAIKVLDEKRIVLAGHNGGLLIGNAKDGFSDLSTVDDNQNFTAVEWFEDRLFLASNFGLFTYDPATKKIEKYAITLKPDLKDTHLLEAKDGVLWSFGFKDLAYFDGKKWTRVDHPDNPPIR